MYLGKLGVPLSTSQLKELVKDADQSEDGLIDFMEFLSVVVRVTSASPPAQAGSANTEVTYKTLRRTTSQACSVQ